MKKIIVIIVEGISDEIVLSAGLSQLLDDDTYRIQVVRGNLLTSDFFTQKPTKALIGDYVKNSILIPLFLNKSDVAYIFQIVDIDDVYTLPNLNQYQDLHKKRLNELSVNSKIMGIPYSIYYMSTNLEDVLVGRKDCTDDEKEEISTDFATNYMDDFDGFKAFFDTFITNFSNYTESWCYIKSGGSDTTSNLSYLLKLIEEIVVE